MDYPKGIILAAGGATRLPNKVLLPTSDGRSIISRLIHHFHFNGINDISVVVSTNSMLKSFLRVKHDIVSVREQDTPNGVVDAIRCGWMWHDKSPVFVACADNIFPLHERFPNVSETSPCMAQVRAINDFSRCMELDCYQDNAWWGRQYRNGANKMCVAGWWFFNRIPSDDDGPGIINTLNAMKAIPVEYTGEAWWDLGTYTAYKQYWDGLYAG
jgi:hypothetical protein